MSVKFIHTADLQLAKPYGSIQDEEKRIKLKNVRFDVFTTIKKMVEEEICLILQPQQILRYQKPVV